MGLSSASNSPARINCSTAARAALCFASCFERNEPLLLAPRTGELKGSDSSQEKPSGLSVIT